MAIGSMNVSDNSKISNEISTLKDNLDELKSSNIGIGKNLIGNELNKLYPVYIEANTQFTVSRSDGTTGWSQEGIIRLYDENMGLIDRKSGILTGNRSRTMSFDKDIYYISIEELASVPMQLEIGSVATSYEPYMYIMSNKQLTQSNYIVGNNIQSIQTQYGPYLTSVQMTSVDSSKTLFILSDITAWYNKTTSKHVNFTISGNVVFLRNGHLYPDSNFGSIDIRLGYINETNFDYRLRSSIGAFCPIIVSKVDGDGNTGYYLAINYLHTQNATILFSGMIYINDVIPYPVFTNKVAYSSSKTIPDGYTIVKNTERMTQSNLALGSQTNYYDYDKIKALEDRIAALENK